MLQVYSEPKQGKIEKHLTEDSFLPIETILYQRSL